MSELLLSLIDCIASYATNSLTRPLAYKRRLWKGTTFAPIVLAY